MSLSSHPYPPAITQCISGHPPQRRFSDLTGIFPLKRIPAPAIAALAWEDGIGVPQFPPALHLTSVLVVSSASCMKGEGSPVNWRSPTSSCRLSLAFITYIDQDNLPGYSCKASASLLGKGFASDCCQDTPKVLSGMRRRLNCNSKDKGDPLSAPESEHCWQLS